MPFCRVKMNKWHKSLFLLLSIWHFFFLLLHVGRVNDTNCSTSRMHPSYVSKIQSVLSVERYTASPMKNVTSHSFKTVLINLNHFYIISFSSKRYVNYNIIKYYKMIKWSCVLSCFKIINLLYFTWIILYMQNISFVCDFVLVKKIRNHALVFIIL